MDQLAYDHSVPPSCQWILKRFGEPVGIEEARARLSALVTAAESGTITLIAAERGRGPWVALVPLSEVSEPLERTPVWSLSAARPKFGELVAAASRWLEPVTQVLARYNRPVAALISARLLDERPDGPDRADAHKLLVDQGASITLEFSPGNDGWVDEDGDVLAPPEPEHFTAVAHDSDGAQIASGTGDTLAEALLALRVTPAPSTADDAWNSGEPPF